MGRCSSPGGSRTTIIEERKALCTKVKGQNIHWLLHLFTSFLLMNFALTLLSVDSPQWEARGREMSANEENITVRDSK